MHPVFYLGTELGQLKSKERHSISILLLLVLVIKQWSRDHTHLTPANGHQKIVKITGLELIKISFSRNFFQLQISTGWQMLDGTRNPDVDGEPLKNAFANVLGATAVASGPSR